jgi:Superinfection immunity protein
MVHTLGLLFFPIFGSMFVFYFLPSIVAFARSKRDSAAILILNLLLGWTAIGWIIALVWSLKADVPVIAR